MNTPNFWKFFEEDAHPKPALRQSSLRYVCEHLDRKDGPVFADYATTIGLTPAFSGYQASWSGF